MGVYTDLYTGIYTSHYTDIYTGIYTSHYTDIYTSHYTDLYTGIYTSHYTDIYTHLYTGIYTSHYTHLYTGIYTSHYTGTIHTPSTTNSLYLLIFAILYNEAFDSPLLMTLTPSTPTAHIETHTYVLTHMTLPPITYIPPTPYTTTLQTPPPFLIFCYY